MSRLKNSLIRIHNFTGTVLSLMFVIWFLSGFVLIYAGFPHASKKERFLHLNQLTQSDFRSIQMPSSSFSGRVELEKMNDTPVYRVYKGRKSQKVYNAVTLKEIKGVSEKYAIALAEDFNGNKIAKVEKLKALDQWMPWSYYKPLLPFYKCVMSDNAHTRLYISEKTGNIVQQTTRTSRWAARLGAIPHWIYFKSLRLKKGLWLKVVFWISIFGVFVSLSGLIAGILRLKKRKQNDKWTGFSPYKKFWHKWHHVTGFVFGLFVFTFILSGMFSVSDIPQWLVPVHSNFSPRSTWNQKLKLKENSQLRNINLCDIIDNKRPIRKVVWKKVMNQPCIWVYRNHFELPDVYLTKENSISLKKGYSKKEVSDWMDKLKTKLQYNLNSLKEYDAYYQKSGMWERPLPVWQIDMMDKDKTTFYVHPLTGECIKSYNTNDRWRRWLYRSLHTFDFPFLKQHEWLRKGILLFLSLGGLIVSLSGLVLGIKWMKRKLG